MRAGGRGVGRAARSRESAAAQGMSGCTPVPSQFVPESGLMARSTGTVASRCGCTVQPLHGCAPPRLEVVVAETRQVRSGTEQYYQRTARHMVVAEPRAAGTTAMLAAVAQALDLSPAETRLTLRPLRLSPAKARELGETLAKLVDEAEEDAESEPVRVGISWLVPDGSRIRRGAAMCGRVGNSRPGGAVASTEGPAPHGGEHGDHEVVRPTRIRAPGARYARRALGSRRISAGGLFHD